jgi:asparaginyl-tRNA synthetase
MPIESTPATGLASPLTTISDIGKHEGQSVTLRGWLYNLRASGKLLFPIFRDGTGTIQGIVPKAAVPEHVFETLKSLTLESSLVVTGRVRADSRAPSGFELDVDDVTITQRIPDETPYPIQLKEAGVDFLMENRHLWIRTPRQSSILRVRATIMRAAAEYFDTNGFIRTDPPILTPNACEGTSELFEMDYFDNDKAYLTQSGQLYIEATAMALGRVYSFGPTFRAEKSKTRRHLTEFWMIEPEVTYMDLDGLMDLAQSFLTHIVTRVLETHRADLKLIGKDITKLEAILAPTNDPGATSEACHPERSAAESKDPDASNITHTAGALSATKLAPASPASANVSTEGAGGFSPLNTPTAKPGFSPGATPAANRFPRLTYDEAHAMLLDAHAKGLIETVHQYGDDFGSPDETYISSQFTKPVMVHRYPASVKAFYMQPDPQDPTKALCVDVLAPEGYGEIIGGSQRVDDYDLLKSRIEAHNLPMAAFQWYLDLRKYGSVPHSGFGMGIERCVAWICGLEHVRETIPFPRTLNRIYP